MTMEGNVTGTPVSQEAVVDSLNKLLRGELSAVETYTQAIERLRDADLVRQLSEIRSSHEERVLVLRQQVQRLGGESSKTGGFWGGFAKLVEGGAKVFGERAAVAALEEGEDHGLRLYRNEMDRLDAVSRELVTRSLLPEQERTHQAMSALKHTLH